MSTKDRSLKDVKKKMTKGAEFLQVLAKPIIALITFLLPIVIAQCRFCHAAWKKLPKDTALVLIGTIFCFFGGLYPTVFAAIMAAEHGGLTTVRKAMSDLCDEALIIIEESKKDDHADDDGDGKKDVDDLSGRELMVRKTKLVMRKMNPEKVDRAIASIYKVWLAVFAVLTIQFARTINMALSISEFLKKPVDRFIAPTLQLVIPDEYDKWVPVVLGWIAKSIGMSIAWSIQTVISAATSAMQGGLIMSRGLMSIGRKRGVGFLPPDHETYIDEVAAYAFAGLGFYFQFRLGFDVPFPFNWILWPFELAEHWIRWSITSAN